MHDLRLVKSPLNKINIFSHSQRRVAAEVHRNCGRGCTEIQEFHRTDSAWENDPRAKQGQQSLQANSLVFHTYDMKWQIHDLCQALMAFDFLNLASLRCLEDLMRHDMSLLVSLLYSAVISLYLFLYDIRLSPVFRHIAVSCDLLWTLRTSLLLPQETGDVVRLEATRDSKVHAGRGMENKTIICSSQNEATQF